MAPATGEKWDGRDTTQMLGTVRTKGNYHGMQHNKPPEPRAMNGHGHAHNTSKVVVSIVVAVASLGTGPSRHSLCPHVVVLLAWLLAEIPKWPH
jgi:hypothetical protein